MEQGLTPQQIISELTRSPHGDLSAYVPTGARAVRETPDLFAHLVAWNHAKGQVRDAKIALPVLALSGPAEYHENALAHLADLDPRSLVRALDFVYAASHGTFTVRTKTPDAKDRHVVTTETVSHPPLPLPRRTIRRLVERYLRDREASPAHWDRTALQHGRSLRTLYARYRVKPNDAIRARTTGVLFDGVRPAGSVFDAVRSLATMPAQEAAGTIVARKIPFLIAAGALGARMKEPDLVLALIRQMSPTELVTNTKLLQRLGVQNVPALRSAFEEGLQRAGKAKASGAALKAQRAAATITETEQPADGVLAGKLQALQEQQLDRLGGIEGNWLVLGDKSGSMAASIEAARVVAATLTRLVKGQVHLVFFDEMPRYVEATGQTLEQLQATTAGINANGGTCIGCGLGYAMERGFLVDGIAIVSDGGENRAPVFAVAYARYAQKFGITPPVYFYRVAGDPDALTSNCKRADVELQAFDLTGGVDYYSLPNLAQTMRASRYALTDEILATPLATLDDVLTRTKGMPVLTRRTMVTV